MTAPASDANPAPYDWDTLSEDALRELLERDDARLVATVACVLGDRMRAKELATLDATTRERLADLLAHPGFMVRLEAAIALAELRDERAVGTLVEALRYRNHRLDATRALGRAGHPRATAPLLDILRRRWFPWADKLQAAAALCALGDPEGQAYLLAKAFSRKWAERAAAIHFVAESHHPDALETLVAIVADTRDRLRDSAARALAQLGDRRAIAALEHARSDASGELREDIDAAIEELRTRGDAGD